MLCQVRLGQELAFLLMLQFAMNLSDFQHAPSIMSQLASYTNMKFQDIEQHYRAEK